MLAAEHARLYGICDETALRNRLIKIEFEQLKKDCPGEIVERIIQQLAGKKWNGIILSYEQMKSICYPRGEEKEKTELAIQLSTEIDELQPVIIKHHAIKTRRTEPRRR